MTEEIFLIATKTGIDRMVKTEKSATNLRKSEIPIRIKITIPDDNWKPPFIEKEIVINRWDKGIELEDVEFEGQYVTEEEAQWLREKRIERAKEMLEGQGYSVEKVNQEVIDENV